MKRVGIFRLLLVFALVAGNTVLAQGVTNSALRGRVTNEGQGLPGVSVELKATTLQGARVAVTSSNGDYAFAALPPGEYTVTFKLQGFETVTKTVSLVTAQQATLDANVAVAGVTAIAAVTAVAETVSTTTQASTTLTTELTNKLPITRTLLSAVELSS
ncbi:MAG TPA: carboxypeptidase-like regulatory domain-containing protein, partial [Thermoanaerobaculia bacterium]|nr:carboxypeptidase-like regulatory domain-containing protein [Thermoanaerobaculia bacterium]